MSQASKARTENDIQGSIELYRVAISKYEEALSHNPTNKEILRNTALCLTRLCEELMQDAAQDNRLHPFSMNDPFVQRADQYFIRALVGDASDVISLYLYAKFLWRCDRLERTEEYILKCLESDPNFSPALRDYSSFLLERGEIKYSELFANSYTTAFKAIAAE